MEIRNENYISIVEALLSKYDSTKDADHLEKIHNILSNQYISSRFADDQFMQLNKMLKDKGFDSLIKGNIDEEIGTVEFPVVGENNDYNSIMAIVVNDGDNNIDIDPKIKSEKELFYIIRFIQDEIQRNLCDIDEVTKDTTILNWGLTFDIREHLLKGSGYVPDNYEYCIKGTSLHFAAVVACVSKLFNMRVNSNYIFTGSFNEKGKAIKIKDLNGKFKLITKERPNTQKIFIPPRSNFSLEEQSIIASSDKFIEVTNVLQLIEKAFNKKLQDITKLDLISRKNLGRARIWAESIGERDLTFSKDFLTVSETKNVLVFHFVRPDNDPTAFKIFPIDKVYHEFINTQNNFIIFEGAVVNHYTGNLMTSNDYRQSSSIFGVRLGRSSEVIVFAAPRGSNLLGYKCDFFRKS